MTSHLSDTIIEVDDLTAGYERDNPVFSNISMTVKRGQFTAIVGGNGCGKSTLLRVILGLHPVVKGEVRLFGEPLSRFRMHRRIGYLPQTPNLLPSFPANVMEIVCSGLLSEKSFPRRITAADRLRAVAVLQQLGVESFQHRFISELSGGQRRKVLLARALVTNPELLIMDEPTTELDPASREAFYTMLRHLNTDCGVTILLVSHDSATVGVYASHLAVMDDGLLFHGTFHEFCQSEAMCARFGQYAQHLICHQHDCGGHS